MNCQLWKHKSLLVTLNWKFVKTYLKIQLVLKDFKYLLVFEMLIQVYSYYGILAGNVIYDLE